MKENYKESFLILRYVRSNKPISLVFLVVFVLLDV
jgi:hypothetical protein